MATALKTPPTLPKLAPSVIPVPDPVEAPEKPAETPFPLATDWYLLAGCVTCFLILAALAIKDMLSGLLWLWS
jgi:hypothetical protein